MIAEFMHMLKEMHRRVVPVGQEGLEEVLSRTVHVKLSARENAVIEYYSEGVLVQKPGPKMLSTMSKADFSEATKRWIHTELLPTIQNWTTENSKDMLPRSMAALSVLIGFDIEKFIVTTERGACNVCGGTKNCGSADHFMWHVRVGSGVILLTFQGMSPSEIKKPAPSKPAFEVPRTARIIAPTGCEAQNNWAIPATVSCLVNILLNEQTSEALASAFGADAAERLEVNRFLKTLGLEEVGLRISESNTFKPDSVANALLKQYVDSRGGVPKNSLNTQTEWIFERTIPVELWAEVATQEDFSLEKVKNVGNTAEERFHNKLHRMAFLYHYLDNQMPVYMVQVALMKFFVSHPLALLMGNDIYVQEVTDAVVEVLARVCVEGSVWWSAPNAKLPETFQEMFELLDSVHRLGFEQRRLAYQNGAYRILQVSRKDMPMKKEMFWSTSWQRAGSKTKPETASSVGKKRKTNGFQPLEKGEVMVEGGGGCKIRMLEIVAKGGAGVSGLDDYDVSDGPSDGAKFQMGPSSVQGQISPNHVPGADVNNENHAFSSGVNNETACPEGVDDMAAYLEDVSDDDLEMDELDVVRPEGVSTEKRVREPSLDSIAPASKKFGAASEHEDLPHVGSRLSDDRIKLMRKLFPEMEALIRMVVQSDEITADEFNVIFKSLQNKITAIQTETHVGKLSGLNDQQAARHDKEMADMKRGLDGLKRRIVERNKDIKRLQARQTLDKEALKKKKLVIEARESAEEYRRKQYVKQGREKLDRRQKDAMEAAQMLLEETMAKMTKPVQSSATAETTIVRTLARIEGAPSAEPVHERLATWANQAPYDISRSQVINTSAVIDLAIQTTVFQEALAIFNAMKDNDNVGSLSGVGTALADIRRATPNGAASWMLCNARMEFLRLMKRAFDDTQDSKKKLKMWSDADIVNAKSDGPESRAKKIADNRNARGQQLVRELAIAFNQAIVEITGGNLYNAVLWYDEPDFSNEYRNMFEEGLNILCAAAEAEGSLEYVNNRKRAKAAMEALMAQRQRPPVDAEACEIINRGLRVTVEYQEEELDGEDDAVEAPEEAEEDDVEMDAANQNVQESNRRVLEVDEEERYGAQRNPAHLTNYRK